MYFLLGVVVILCILSGGFCAVRKKEAICKIERMDCEEKCALLDRLLEPFGFLYCPQQDIVTSGLDAWQREYGYSGVFDRAASSFHMIFNCETVYFDYEDRTWLIEFWKGQYGLNTGGEVGVYRSDSLLDPAQYKSAFFHSVEDKEMLPVSIKLKKGDNTLFAIKKRHWWLTGFCVGTYSEPQDLKMDVSILFPNGEMQRCFEESLRRLGYREDSLCICGRMVHLSFDLPHSLQPCSRYSIRCRWIQWCNRKFCCLYQYFTRFFNCTGDKILYLFYSCPLVWRCMCHFMKKWQKKRRRA